LSIREAIDGSHRVKVAIAEEGRADRLWLTLPPVETEELGSSSSSSSSSGGGKGGGSSCRGKRRAMRGGRNIIRVWMS